jgi:hypothetical protein
VVAQGTNFANLSVVANNTVVTSWGWSDWVNKGEDSLKLLLNSTENITLRFGFILEELDKEFEANWKITITEIDWLKQTASDLQKGFWNNLIFGVLIIGILYKGSDYL